MTVNATPNAAPAASNYGVSAEILEQTKSMKVLVVDDSKTLRRILIRELNSIGITNISEAGDGNEAVERLRVESFDLMLLDMEMPELDGLGVLKVVKSTPELSYLPVIIVSSAEDFDRIVECIQVGAEDYLPKPFNAVLLRARVFSSLEKKRLRDLDREHILELQREKEMLHIEQMKSEKLMLNILPKPIADRLKKGEKNIAGSYPEVTVLFSDLVGFTKMSAKKTAPELVKLLNDIFSRFDKRAELLGLEKIKTIGDAYMAVGGLPIPRSDHAEIVADMALGMYQDLADFNQANQQEIQMRIGIHSGPVVAGVIGFTKFSYDLWGNTVNTASRMESTSGNGRIQVSAITHELLKEHFVLEERELIECKGLGPMLTSYVNARIQT
jgi:class 3 adenylate cyclase